MDTLIPLDLGTLRVIWWVLLGALLIGFAIMDGFDLGVAALLPFVAKNDAERRIAINVVGPVWEGNQVWLITAGGAIFAAWPLLYAAAFSGFYLAMLLLLLALILRPVAFKYRSKMASPRWRNNWDYVLCGSGLVASLVFGVAMGNVILGVPHDFHAVTLRSTWSGHFFQLFTPFAVLAGLISVFMLLMHGAVLLAWRTEDPVAGRARRLGQIAALLTALLFVAAGFWVARLDGYVITNAIHPDGPANPMIKEVIAAPGAWLHNFTKWPLFWIAPAMGVAGALLTIVLLALRVNVLSFLTSSLTLTGIILTVGFALFPFIMPSALNPKAGLTIWDASSSRLTLWVMLIAVAVFLPLVTLYTAWVYRVMRGKVTQESISDTPNSY
ncbi:cytochrome d ubiquinol oxidase subunit II [Bordetella avium]|uniref:Cytochrome D ubiquinol oxidase subunit II n=1 Tax=Bordetella avium (strain 197N) TaxID=360910 RepID=Q2KUE0_BORA1|nr:cytochrome d ubiquinol oxidase subunit II [Bordetella avium]AZY50445.1 cytochrome d ubiquinol oxidase subunit II [Bordetella avium]AZY53841.1 cytochrome d ubiquinol oxidase subunit II [Bordetella avium]RIQ15386.1 cytochrome d ubiquinol oxidase subunit II [Bordetella avium]RIQ19808.1 cytochrome d ubiquinol oxidase subunit II [Bordetella avium]RIQ34388.1 cytochrome d ubiquinol oxidase subunit II [Bordetella avium]